MPRKRDQLDGVRCPECGAGSHVIDSRPVDGSNAIRRRRVCRGEKCGHRFTTIEAVAAVQLGQGRPVKGYAGYTEEMRRELERLAERMLAVARPEKEAAEGMLAGLQL